MDKKTETILEKRKLTQIKRQTQVCRVFELKIDESKLSKKDQEKLKMFFVEAKWIYNHILGLQDINIFNFNYKNLTIVDVLNKDREVEQRELKYLPAKQRQDVIFLMRDSIKSLAKKKEKGKVGKLKFKSEYKSLELSQYGITHKIVGNKVKINGIKKPLKVYGLDQIKPYMEIANGKLVKKPSGYYILLTTYSNKPIKMNNNLKKEVGLDFGIKTSITTSEREKFNISIGESERLKRLQRKLSKKKKGSNNRYKLILKIRKEHEKITNKKKDKSNKVISYLLTNYSRIYIQDENLVGWQKGLFGKQVQHSCLGTIKKKLIEKKNQCYIIDRFLPTTKYCFKCGKEVEITLNERVFKCECGYIEDRDIKAAKTVLYFGKINNIQIPMEHREFKPVEKISIQVDNICKNFW